MLSAAIAYAKKQLAVFPCRPRDKRPATEHGCLDATVDLSQIAAWWRAEPEANIGMATGDISKVFVSRH